MAVFEVYSHPELRRYKTSVCSKASLVQLFCLALTWIPPLLIALRSQGFWQRLDTFSEQADIKFKHQLIVQIQTSTVGDYVTWSTYQNLNQLQMSNLRVPLIKVREEDVNRDGLYDVLNLQLDMPLLDTEPVYGVKLLLIFDYVVSKFAFMQMESAAFIEYTSPISGSALQFSGDLKLRQRRPVGHKGTDGQYNTSIINPNSVFAEDFDWSNILKQYSARNLSTVLDDSYPVWSSGRGAGKPFVIEATIRYPQEFSILYTPGFWQLIKFGWVQYVALLVIFWFIFQKIKVFIFSNQLVTTIVERPFKQKTT